MLGQRGPRSSTGNTNQRSKDTREALDEGKVETRGKGRTEKVNADSTVVENVRKETPSFAVRVHLGALDGCKD